MKYTYSQPVRYSEADETGRLSIGALIDLQQDTATMHSAASGYSVERLLEEGLAWILASWQIEIDELPKIGQQMSCTTWGYEFKGFYGLRNCVLKDEEGKDLAWSNSNWVLFDVKAQRPARISQEMIDAFGPEERYKMEYASRKLPPVKEGEQEEHFLIAKAHLDTNHHVNNVQYVRFAQAYLPENFRIRKLQVEYRAQAHLGDEICPCVDRQPDRVVVGLNDVNGKPYATVVFHAAEASD